MPHLPLAHETWFVSHGAGLDWDFATRGLSLGVLAVAVVVAVAVRLLARVFPGLDVPFLARLAPYMPFAVRIHLGVSLVGLLSLGYYLSPTMSLDEDLSGVLLGAVMAVVAVGMVTGYRAREAALLLIAAGPVGMAVYGFLPTLQRVDLLGLALFVLIAGGGRWSADYERGEARDPDPLSVARAVWCLRVAAGVALIVVAFREKLAGPDLAHAFLREHPEFDLADQLGLPMGRDTFITVAGAIEVLFGLLLISGALPQAIVLIAGVPFNTTLWFFGAEELVGHLPIYGAMLVLLVYGSHPVLRPQITRLWPWSGALREDPVKPLRPRSEQRHPA